MEQATVNKYFDNTASEKEEQQVINWLTDSSKRSEVLAWMEIYWQETKLEAMTPPLFENILRKARERESIAEQEHTIVRRKKFSYMVAAACFCFLALGVWMGFFMRKETHQDNYPLFASAETKKGERTQIKLNDGSEVFLNGDSKLFFAKDSATKSQIIYLEGEAFFSQIQEGMPLIIKTKDIVTTAKGAQFNISAFPSDSLVKVFVNKGKAEVKKNTEPFASMMKLVPAKRQSEQPEDKQPEEHRAMALIKLMPSLLVREKEAMTFDKKKGNGDVALTAHNDNTANWKDGILSFQNANKEELIDKLERWYGITLVIDIEQSNQPLFTGDFTNVALQDILTVISKEWQVKYKIEGNNVFIGKY